MLEIKIPNYPLNQFIDCFIYFESFTSKHTVDRFLPDGNTEIVIDLKDTPQYIYDNETLEEKQVCKNAWASGVRTEFISIPSGQDSAMLIIYFKKGMAYPFFPFPMTEMADRVVDTDLLFGQEFGFLREAILEESDVNKRLEITEEFLVERYVKNIALNPCVEYAVDQIVGNPTQINLGLLYRKIGYSQKHFTDMFKTHVGVTPKAYVKLMRFQYAINEIETNESISWTSIANDSGFYDQAHFIKDFKRFSGFTPEDYLKKKNGMLNYVPVG